MIVEDGTGLTNAETLVSLEDANSYLTARGHPEITSAQLVQGMDAFSVLQFRGDLLNDPQALPFPRVNLVDDAGQPLSTSTALNAAQAAQIWTSHYISQGHDPAAVGERAVKKQKVDVIEREFFGDDDANTKVTITDFPMVLALLKPYLSQGAVSGSVSGHIDHA